MNSLHPLIKLVFEIAVGFFLCAIDIRLVSFGGFIGIYELPIWLSYVLTIFFFIIVSNAYNLIDGIDGQAALQAIVTLGTICLFLKKMLPENTYLSQSGFDHPYFWLMVIAAMLGAIAGFLVFNWQKARVFMGDTGSIFIGYVIAIAMIVSMNISVQNYIHLFDFEVKSNLVVILTFFFLPLADTLRVFILRVRKGKSPLYPDKTHIHHLLLRIKGFSHWQCAVTAFVIQFAIIVLMLCLSLMFDDNILAIIVFVTWVVYVIALKYLVKENIKNITK
jgi:UDP-N-acetylmuramyl pentapeptide phosphotransferase/UDP-N-acetylglucosamine-1-phosphate transferase